MLKYQMKLQQFQESIFFVIKFRQNSNLIKVKWLWQPPNIKLPCSWITNPTLTLLSWISILTPNRMRQNLQYFLRLRIAVWITQTVRHLKMLCIPWGTMQVIGCIRELSSVIPMNTCSIGKCVVRWAEIKVVRMAPWTCIWVYDHFAVSCNVWRDISIARLSIVLPTASYVQ